MLAALISIIVLVLAGWAIAKNYDAKVVLFAAGLILMYAALLLGHDVLSSFASIQTRASSSSRSSVLPPTCPTSAPMPW